VAINYYRFLDLVRPEHIPTSPRKSKPAEESGRLIQHLDFIHGDRRDPHLSFTFVIVTIWACMSRTSWNASGGEKPSSLSLA
jgi:hypothetical protein